MTTVDLATQYQKKTDKQHILDNPDTYIGSVEDVEQPMWIFDENSESIIYKNINYIPGLYKLFDEGIVNCRDHVVRMMQSSKNKQNDILLVSQIQISIEDDGTITMINDGNGIDVAKHPEYDVWIPELVFGHLRTSTNYNKNEKRIVGGKNGFGFKLVLIWSTYGSIETVDHVRKLKYTQTFRDNLDVLEKPTIRKCSTKPYTKITFKPDYKRLGISGLTQDFINMLKKRVYDICAITDKNVKVKYNNNLIGIKSFQQYIDLYIGDKDESKRVYESSDTRWEYAVSLTPQEEFCHVSFVNGIYTYKGGKHVDYILGQITKKLIVYIEKKKKVTVNANSIKEQIILFLRCDIDNPSFDSQTKDYMNTPVGKFGSSCSVSDKFIEKIAKMGIMETACNLTEVKENKNAKKSDGNKTKNIRGIHKLIDANWAGTDKSNECMIIFCEGDSAKAGIVSGLSTSDRNIIGVYPMKGKILNVRGELTKKIIENKEIVEIKKILGLEAGKKYTAESMRKTLRYGRILFMTDQDLDGSHIKGLGINLFQSEWASLAKIDGFIGFMNTPILKAKKGSQTLVFYNEGEYEAWKNENDISGWKIKYYKGLGTSTGVEFKEYFSDRKEVLFKHGGNDCDNAIDMVFNKKRADDRKVWLGDYNRELYLDTNKSNVSYQDFIDREMIHFSKYDCDRSIPNLMDGLKISLRKILYSAFKKNLTNEIKVAQFSGYVSEHSGYHHGEASLNAAIVGMAQNFVGSNNINLFEPNGQFGTRLQGGKDSASERYIFTQLNAMTRTMFSPLDDKVLNYLDDDGFPVEPVYYAPIIPMVLVNGSKGIGTGFSTEILSYNPLDIIDNLLDRISGSEPNTSFKPYYEGFEGSIVETDTNKYSTHGKFEILKKDTIIITELPVGTWTDDYKQFLESLMDSTDKNGKKIQPLVKEYDDMSKSTNVEIHVTFCRGRLEEIQSTEGGVLKALKLSSSLSATNMHMFDASEKLKKYDSVNTIIDDYYVVRLDLYQKRKDYMIEILKREIEILSNKRKYIIEVLDGSLELRRRKKVDIIDEMKTKEYAMMDEDDEFKYLLKMPMDSVNDENVSKLIQQCDLKQSELEKLMDTTIHQMWSDELMILKEQYVKYKQVRSDVNMDRKRSSKAKK